MTKRDDEAPAGINEDLPRNFTANPGYAVVQLGRALRTSVTHPDGETRQRAAARMSRWRDVLRGMQEGSLSIGSSAPVVGTPAWVTLDVVHGGFATGRLSAAGPLLRHEFETLKRLGHDVPANPDRARALLNAHYLGEAGMAELRDLLARGAYRLNVPEEGALLVLAWLLREGHDGEALSLVATLVPWLGKLRFYPVPLDAAPAKSQGVSVQTIEETVRDLQSVREPVQRLAERETLLVWMPLFDQMMDLFLETVAGEPPSVEAGADGRPLRGSDGSWPLAGGWPCQHFPQDWTFRASSLLSAYRRLRLENRLCRRPERASSNFAVLRRALQKCVADPSSLTGREVGRIRRVLALALAKRGRPGSPGFEKLRRSQRRQAKLPTKAELASLLAGRLGEASPAEGIDDPASFLTPVTADEERKTGIPEAHPIPDFLDAKLRRSWKTSVENLVESRVVTSGEMLARLVPQLAGEVLAADLPDQDLRRLHSALYQAFQDRRSLLLLNLQRQTGLSDLPWIGALDGLWSPGEASREGARSLLRRLALLTLTAFPESIFPNKLVQQFSLLSRKANLSLPWVEEIAADIFMGVFTVKYQRAAHWAGNLLADSVYAAYYDLDFDLLPSPGKDGESSSKPPVANELSDLCRRRAGLEEPTPRWVAANGAVLEQGQIFTTHNLAVAVAGLDLAGELQPHLPDMARSCFRYCCRLLERDWDLRAIKNAAYAWRQMVFYLALMPSGEVAAFVSWAGDTLDDHGEVLRRRFRPALDGLASAARGIAPSRKHNAPEGRCFLGWAPNGIHWLQC